MISKGSKRVSVTLDRLAISNIKLIFNNCSVDEIDSRLIRYLVDIGIENLLKGRKSRS